MKRWYGAMVAVTLPFAVFEVVLVLLLAIGTFPDLSPNTAGGDLDRCWAVGLNMSVAKGMVYGRDVAWTYGPLGFIFWVLDIGHNVESAVCFRLLIFALFWCCIALQVHSSRRVLAGVLLVSVAILSGVDIFCYDVLLISVIGFTTQSWLRKSFLLAIPAAFLTGLGLVAKINIGIGCCMSMIAWGSLVFLERPTRGTLVRLGGVAAVAGLSLLGLFCAYGGPLSALPAYFYTSFLIASGYSAQM